MLYDDPRPGVATPWFSVIGVACGAGGGTGVAGSVYKVRDLIIAYSMKISDAMGSEVVCASADAGITHNRHTASGLYRGRGVSVA